MCLTYIYTNAVSIKKAYLVSIIFIVSLQMSKLKSENLDNLPKAAHLVDSRA